MRCILCGRFASERDDLVLNGGRCDRCLPVVRSAYSVAGCVLVVMVLALVSLIVEK